MIICKDSKCMIIILYKYDVQNQNKIGKNND